MSGKGASAGEAHLDRAPPLRSVGALVLPVRAGALRGVVVPHGDSAEERECDQQTAHMAQREEMHGELMPAALLCMVAVAVPWSTFQISMYI